MTVRLCSQHTGGMTRRFDLNGVPYALRTAGRSWINSGDDGQPWSPARPSRHASSSDPATWSDFADAVNAAIDLGRRLTFALDDGNRFSAIDLDHCRDPKTGTIAPWAWALILHFRTYFEVSSSGEGVHGFIEGKIRGRGGCRRGGLELYSRRKFMTVTGWHIAGTATDVQPRQAELDSLVDRLFPLRGMPPARRDDRLLSDPGIVDRITNSEKGARLWRGDWSGYPSQSEADQALVSIIAKMTGDPGRIDNLFRQSGLVRPKWERRENYRHHTIMRALG